MTSSSIDTKPFTYTTGLAISKKMGMDRMKENLTTLYSIVERMDYLLPVAKTEPIINELDESSRKPY